ncbi:hypothetical protein [Ensifer aridi]|uniref:hypothetical protein n=1 Tax=Ensifer aridi TaxID=1708715 RepID=UPI00040E4D19|nr:hypothetical protein [Ensifer aridi]
MKEPAPQPVREPPVASAILFLLTGPILWAGHLTLVYAFQSVTCAIGAFPSAATVIPAFVALATLVAAMVLLVAIWAPERLTRYRSERGENQTFLRAVSRLLSVLSLTGVLWTGSAAFALDACGRLR